MEKVFYLLIPLVISAILIPFVKVIGTKCKIYAVANSRTVHNGIIAQCGGIAVYVAFMIGMALFMNADRQMNALMIGGSIVFFSGLFDDMYNLKPKQKLAFQIVAALILIFYGRVQLNVFRLPFGIVIRNGIIIDIISFFWIIGITNAINLIDGLDGLCGGVCTIALLTIASLAYIDKHFDVMTIALILSGGIIGFLFYNFHPASIFMGDSGALFIGFIISGISLLGFKSSTFITLGVPLLVLLVPIMDTLVAILRRTLAHKRFDEADRKHLHHVLMYNLKLGHRNTVLFIYFFTLMLSVNAYLYIYNKTLGLISLIIIAFGIELFLELTQMISNHYRPLCAIYEMLKERFIKTTK
ncbi:MAG: undecaprenyl/decaprenyl-phosphate alpha-N-acetylglucosaminyl 1-phosphate transferase [Erysipelotrichales bacterium]|nr:undecaprenyl/decaprenyl-phosphate alpha-N-acetylglucosaminyl 1-phosphate transferase [Erysipelotrichales bacterium]